ncbi:MAG: hypothetical protein WAN75_02160, partial [Xanthobacteraceae bacterium]
LHHDDLLRFHSHRSFNGRVPPRALADVAVPQPAGVGKALENGEMSDGNLGDRLRRSLIAPGR